MASLFEIPFKLRFENAIVAYVKYIGKTLWPHDLAVLYPIPLSIPIWQVIGALFILLLISAATIWAGRQHPYLVLGWFWFLITLVPVIGLIQVGSQSMADRYTYIPAIGLFIMVAWGVGDLTKGLQYRQGINAMLAAAVMIISATLTWHQLGYWENDISLYQHTVQVTSDNYKIHFSLGSALQEKGDLDAAIQEYQKVLRICPTYMKAHINLGFAFQNKGLLDAAIQEYQQALWLNPNESKLHCNLGNALAEKGNLDAAIQEYQVALQLNPNDTKAHNNLGRALAQKGYLDEAIHEFQETLRINPNDPRAQNNLGILLTQKMKLDNTTK